MFTCKEQSLLKVQLLENFDPMVFFSAFVISLKEILNFPSFNLRHLFLKFMLQFLQNLALAKSLADASDSADVLGILLGSDEVKLVFLYALGVEMFLVLEGFQDVFEADVGGRWGLGSWWFVAEGLDLFEVLVELIVGFIEIGVLVGRGPAELLLEFSDEVDQFGVGGPFEDVLVLNLAGHGFDEGVFNPLGDVDDGFFFGVVAEEDAGWVEGYTLRGSWCFWLMMRERWHSW